MNNSTEQKLLNKEQYYAKLEELIRRKGGMLSDDELIMFANENKLFTVYNMHISELKIDYAMLFRKIGDSLDADKRVNYEKIHIATLQEKMFHQIYRKYQVDRKKMMVKIIRKGYKYNAKRTKRNV